MAIKTFVTNVAGVSHRNDDWTHRQRIIRNFCNAGDEVILEPEPSNKFDSNAVKVMIRNGGQIGYLSANVARIYKQKKKKKDNLKQQAFINRVESFIGGEGDKLWFVELTMIEWDASIAEDCEKVDSIIQHMRSSSKIEEYNAYKENIEFANAIVIDMAVGSYKMSKKTWSITKFLVSGTKDLAIHSSKFLCKTIKSAWIFFINSN